MKKRFNTPRGGMIAALCAVLIALWLTAVYGTYEENKREKYDVHITPGAVSYGTHSSATVPVVMTTTRHTSSVPKVSGNAVRSYARYGHASIPSAGGASGYRMHTTSSATVKTIGSGSGGGAGMGTASGVSSSSRGITYGGGSVASVAMPVLAVNSSMMAAPVLATEPSMPRAIGPRRSKPSGTGDGSWQYGGDDPENPSDWWYYDDYEEDWIQVTDGDMRPANDGTGNFYKYSGGAWVYVDDHGNPIAPQPLGATPWLLMMLLACAYALYKYYTHKVYKSK